MALRKKRWNGAHSALIVMATGLGKTFVSAFDVKQYMHHNRGRALFLCHNNGILEQNMYIFQLICDGGFSYGLFNGLSKAPEADFVFASFQTMLDHKEEFAPDAFKYIVVDEAHHAPAKTFKSVISYFHPEFLLGMTATPERLDGLRLENIFGPITYNLGLVEAIRRGLVVDIDYHLILDEMVNLDTIVVEGEKISINELNRRLFIPKRDEEIVNIIKSKLSELSGSSTLIFCRSIEHAERICALLDGAEVVHSEMNPEQCKDTLDRFRMGELPIIVSVDQLNEGIDIPHADVIVFLRSTASQVVFYQQLGRGLRLHEGKDRAVVLDFVGSYERLGIIAKLREELNAGGKDDDVEHFTLNIEAQQFTEKFIDIASILERINNYTWGWSNNELIAQVRMLAKELGRTPKMREFKNDPRTASETAVFRNFGSWNKFLEVAGLTILKPARIVISNGELIAQVKQLAEELGRTPTAKEFDEHLVGTYSRVAIRHFGSWNKFLEVAELEVNRKSPKCMNFSDEELITWIKQLAEELGRTPTAKEFDEHLVGTYSVTVLKHFGSWNKFLQIAGLKINKTGRMTISNEDLFAQVRQLAKELGRTPTQKEFNPRDVGSATVASYFGSWNKFLKAAGLAINKHHGSSDEELIAQVRQLAKELGRTPTQKEFKEFPWGANPSTPMARFGSWNKFLEAAGLKINKTAHMTISNEDLFVQVRQLAEELGRTPTQKEFRPHNTSSVTVVKHFGSWNKFLEAAGLEVNQARKKGV